MEQGKPNGCDSDDLFEELISKNDEDQNTFNTFNPKRFKVLLSSLSRSQQTALVLCLLAAVLLLVDISLGVHYSKLPDPRLVPENGKHTAKQMSDLQSTFKTAVDAMQDAQKQLDNELKRQQETVWELEHQNKRTKDNKMQIVNVTRDNRKVKGILPKITDGCKYCPHGWLLMNSVCYYFPYEIDGRRSWQEARKFCQSHNGDLLVLDSKDKENITVTHLLSHINPSRTNTGFWFGLRDFQEEGIWKWLNGTDLIEGYWMDDEPSDPHNYDHCAAVYPKENFFKAWKDLKCEVKLKWICEKEQTSIS